MNTAAHQATGMHHAFLRTTFKDRMGPVKHDKQKGRKTKAEMEPTPGATGTVEFQTRQGEIIWSMIKTARTPCFLRNPFPVLARIGSTTEESEHENRRKGLTSSAIQRESVEAFRELG